MRRLRFELIQPRSARRSRLISSGFPAKAEVEEYGELPLAGGPSGKTCHKPWRADGKEINKLVGRRTKIPDATARREEVGCSRIPVARGNDIVELPRCYQQIEDRVARRALLSLFPAWARVSCFISSSIDLDLARLLHLVAQIPDEQAENFLLLALQQRITNLVFLGREILMRSVPVFQPPASTTPVLPLLIGPLISPGFIVKATEAPPAMEPMSGTCPSGSTMSLVFMVAPSFFGGFLQVVASLGAVRKFLRFLRQQTWQLAHS